MKQPKKASAVKAESFGESVGTAGPNVSVPEGPGPGYRTCVGRLVEIQRGVISDELSHGKETVSKQLVFQEMDRLSIRRAERSIEFGATGRVP